MGASPQFKIYTGDNRYIGCMKEIEDCAAVIALRGEGTIRLGHSWVLWREDSESQPAGDSFDFVAEVCHQRLREKQRASAQRNRRQGRPAVTVD